MQVTHAVQINIVKNGPFDNQACELLYLCICLGYERESSESESVSRMAYNYFLAFACLFE